MKEIQPCPTMEELEAETQAHFAKEVEEHGERAKHLLNKLIGKGVTASFNCSASYNSFCSEAFGINFQQRQLASRTWTLSTSTEGDLRRDKHFESLDKLLSHVEGAYFPEKDWGIFDDAVNGRLQLIYKLADENDQRVTIETRPDAGLMKVSVFVMQRHTTSVLHHGTFGKMSEAIASLEGFFNIK